MTTNNLIFVSLLSALLITASRITPVYAVNDKPPITKATPTPTLAPTGQDCFDQANAAAAKVKSAGGTAKEQQAAYNNAKMRCQDKM